MQIVRGRSGPLSRSAKLDFMDRLSLVDSFLGWVAVYSAKMLGLIVPILYLLFGVRAVNANLLELLTYFLPLFAWHAVTMGWVSGGRSMLIMSDVAQFIAAPAVLKAVFVGLIKPQGQKFKVTAKGGDRSLRFVEWPLLKIYFSLLTLTLAGILYAFVLDVSGDRIAFGGLALAWSWYNAIVLLIVCFVCVEQPRRRKAERFAADEPILIEADGRNRIFGLEDVSITGARIQGAPPVPEGAHLRCTLNGRSVGATVVRILPRSFAVVFDEAFNARIDMIRGFYSGNYVKAVEEVAPAGVGRAILTRLLG
jgi:cellulose synthase (UDP-forming)